MKKMQNNIEKVYNDIFGYTPQIERFQDLQKQFFKLMRNTGVKNLKECTGDLLTSLMQLANESGWSVEDLVNENLSKIQNNAETK